jgi:hypothetical protein
MYPNPIVVIATGGPLLVAIGVLKMIAAAVELAAEMALNVGRDVVTVWRYRMFLARLDRVCRRAAR